MVNFSLFVIIRFVKDIDWSIYLNNSNTCFGYYSNGQHYFAPEKSAPIQIIANASVKVIKSVA